jgi:ribosomal protein L11 methyltransferase
MHPVTTYELRITFREDEAAAIKTKERLTDWLLMNGIDSFVEGALDVDFNLNQDEPPRDFYAEMGGDLSPVSVYRYSRESLDDLFVKVGNVFGDKLATEIHSMPTEQWMEGWKESFKPFATDEFYVRPPWEAPLTGSKLIDLVIEPGMAFGTGQHATTRLCLDQVGVAAKEYRRPEQGSPRAGEWGEGSLADATVLDVGTGTGILAIGAKLLGFGHCAGTDIEEDAVMAALENARLNKTDIAVRKGSIPEGGPFDVVFANILAVVILRLMPELAAKVKPGGRLILSGLLTEEEDEIVASALANDLQLISKSQLNDWSCVVVGKPR